MVNITVKKSEAAYKCFENVVGIFALLKINFRLLNNIFKCNSVSNFQKFCRYRKLKAINS